MLGAVTTRLCNQVPKTDATLQGCDDEISIFVQEAFLNSVLKDTDKAVEALSQVQLFFMTNVPNVSGLVHVGMPVSAMDGDVGVECISEAWQREYIVWNERSNLTCGGKAVCEVKSVSPFPFPRVPFSAEHVDAKFGKSVMVLIPGMQSSHMSQFVACDLLAPSVDKRDLLAGMVQV
jgi:hypothetical protein